MTDFHARWRALHSTDRTPIRAEVPPARVEDTTAVLRLYDPIDSYGGPWGVSAKEFAAVLDELGDDVEEIRLLINSPGGEVTEGIAILNLLRSHKAKVVGVVEGLAASSASFIAAGCDELVMARNSEIFIHDAWGLCVGNATDMRQLADELDHLSNNIASVYADKAGGGVEKWRQAMTDETWFGAAEAVAAGLADRVDDQTDGADAKARFDRSIFNTVRPPAPGQTHPVAAPANGPTRTPTEGGPAVAFSDEQIQHLRQALDVADDADEATIFAALDDKLREYAEGEPPAASTTATPPSTATLPEGVAAIDVARLAQLEADAQAGREARAEQLRARRESLVTAAVDDGRIPPARRDAWVAQLEADPGAEQVLASLAKGTIPVAAKGTEAHDLDSEAERDYQALFGQEVTA